MSAPVGMLEAIHARLSLLVAAITGVSFPSVRWRDDPVAFFREVLGVEPWSEQIKILESIRDNKRVAVKSGHKIGKSNCASGIALWFYCSFPDARVMMTSTTARQVDDILWRELRMMRARSGLCVACKAENAAREEQRAKGEHAPPIERPCAHSATIDGVLGTLARTGLKSDNFREIKGATAREKEAVAGVSGKNMLYLADEASGIADDIFQAIEGNRAGGARLVLFSNPTKTSGEFYDAFNSKKEFYACHTISSEETPNVRHGDDDPRAIPGLANREWVEEKKVEWGEESPLYLVRVKGEFAELEQGKIFSVHDLLQSTQRLEAMVSEDLPMKERLYIGLDPAGDGPSGDETVWVARRGARMLSLKAMRGISKESILMHTLGLCSQYQRDREVPVVVMDVEGKVGAEMYGTFTGFLAGREEPPFELVPIRASDRARRRPQVFDRMRDELAGVLLDWIREGGAIVDDAKLHAELHVLEWREQLNGRVKVTPKKEIRKELKRSPDRYDALSLSVWEPLSLRDNRPDRQNTVADPSADESKPDPYSGAVAVDPYG